MSKVMKTLKEPTAAEKRAIDKAETYVDQVVAAAGMSRQKVGDVRIIFEGAKPAKPEMWCGIIRALRVGLIQALLKRPLPVYVKRRRVRRPAAPGGEG